ncbi:MAG TPA: YkgJ family cysteine cluster protein [Anaerolineales bacterium]|nr:YkgJ family cysteine cluster protein [Anaerolineales bacterium]
MTGMDETNKSQGNILCKSCGLCCTGHLFIWTKLRSAELDSAQALGLNVFRSDPRQRGFSQPCPLWQGQCTIYTSPHYPHFCRTYKCKLLKEVLNENISLSNALTVIEQAKELIHELEILLPNSPRNNNFRERLVAQLESLQTSKGEEHTESEFQRKADALLTFYEQVFGVNDLIETPDEY